MNHEGLYNLRGWKRTIATAFFIITGIHGTLGFAILSLTLVQLNTGVTFVIITDAINQMDTTPENWQYVLGMIGGGLYGFGGLAIASGLLAGRKNIQSETDNEF